MFEILAEVLELNFVFWKKTNSLDFDYELYHFEKFKNKEKLINLFIDETNNIIEQIPCNKSENIVVDISLQIYNSNSMITD